MGQKLQLYPSKNCSPLAVRRGSTFKGIFANKTWENQFGLSIIILDDHCGKLIIWQLLKNQIKNGYILLLQNRFMKKQNRSILLWIGGALLLLLLFLLLISIQTYKQRYLYRGYEVSPRSEFVSDEITLNEYLNEELHINDYKVFFDNLKIDHKVINFNTLLQMKYRDWYMSNGIKDNYILRWYWEKCYYFVLPVSVFRNPTSWFGLRNLDFTPCARTKEHECYLILTEKWQMWTNTFYECK